MNHEFYVMSLFVLPKIFIWIIKKLEMKFKRQFRDQHNTQDHELTHFLNDSTIKIGKKQALFDPVTTRPFDLLLFTSILSV